MKEVEVSAPGKLLLTGEYVVLDGASALVMAVDRRVVVRILPARGDAGRLSAAQLGIRQAAMRIENGRLQCEGADRGALGVTGRLIPAIMQALGRAPEEVTAVNIEIDSGALFQLDAGRSLKLGLGSSAAVCAGLAIGLGEWFEDSAGAVRAADSLDRWLPVYRRALGARASGADLGAAFFGGFNRFRATADGAECEPVEWPETLCWRAVWTREAAQTTDFVGAFDAWKRRDPSGADGILSQAGDIAHRASVNAANGTELLDACRAYAGAMEELGKAMGLDIMTAAHRRLADLGRQCGVVYKSCGAGGGDLGIALALNPEQLRTFETGVPDCGGVPLNLAISKTGAGSARHRVPEPGKENQ